MYSAWLQDVTRLMFFSVDPLSEIMDPALTPVVDLPRLRKLCMHGESHHYLSLYDRSRVPHDKVSPMSLSGFVRAYGSWYRAITFIALPDV